MILANIKKNLFGIILCFLFILSTISFTLAQKPSFEVENQPEPTVSDTTVTPGTQDRGNVVVISSKVVDVSGVSYVKAKIKNTANTVVATINLYDDGSHNDGTANDTIFANNWTIPISLSAGSYKVFIIASDTLSNIYQKTTEETNFNITTPTCIPSKICADYPGQCGTNLWNGCANILNCSGSCSVSQICCSGFCQVPVCANNSDCDDGDSCTADVCNNGGSCLASCSNSPIIACLDNDGCCPSGCDSGNDSDCSGCIENWTCTAWTACSGGIQTRTCTDSNSCGTTTNKPSEQQTCLEVVISEPSEGSEFTQGDWINFQGAVLGGVPSYTYEWSSNIDNVFSTTQWASTNLLSVGAHVITLTVSDNNSISASDSINITVRPAGTLTAQIQAWRTEFTNGEWLMISANVSGGTAPYTYVWNSDKEGDFSTDQWPNVDLSVTPWIIGNHIITLTVTDSAGNTAMDTIDIKIVEMTADISPLDGEHFIRGNNVWFSATVIGGTAPYTYSWVSDLDGIIGSSDVFSRDDLQEGIHTIAVTITDSSSVPITITKTFRIQIDPPPVLTVAIDNPADNYIFNQGDDISFEGTFGGGVLPYVFTWTSNLDGTIYTGNNIDPDFTKNNLLVGTHTIILTVEDNAGQTVSDSITITVNPPVILAATINSPSNGNAFFQTDSLIIFEGSASGGVSPYTYQWTSNIDGDITPANGETDKFFKNDLSVNSHTITLTITDSLGSTATDSVNITVNASCADNNVKNSAKYSTEETFLISDDNWQDVLSIVPLAVWNNNGMISKHPALIYHHETATAFDADSTIHFMQMYKPDHLTTIGNIPVNLKNLFTAAEPVGAGINVSNISNIQPSDYFSYWSSFGSLVVVDYNNYKAGLMASAFASYKNSPIIFVNSANLATYQALINGKKIYTVGTLDGATQSYISGNAGCEVDYTLEELQKWYATETSSDKLILVNPLDLNMGLSKSFYPQKSAAISNIFYKTSLAAPFLAGVKKEVIAFTELSDTGSNSGCGANASVDAGFVTADADSANAITNLFSTLPKSLTIISWPQTIPDSKYNYCNGSFQIRKGLDWKYGSLDNINYGLKVGRIYGITISDTSSYIAESIFFDNLIDKIYGAGNYTGLGITTTSSFTASQDKTELVKQKTSSSGYNSICFMEDNTSHPSCRNLVGYPAPPTANWQNQRYILFANHGNTQNWGGSMFYSWVPWLDLSYTMGDACLTNNYWQGIEETISLHMVRKGAIAYFGGLGITCGSSLGPTFFYNIIQDLAGTTSNTITLGEAHSIYNNGYGCSDFGLLGDPTLQLKLKQVTW